MNAYSLITIDDYKSYVGFTLECDAFYIYGSDGTAATVAKSGNTLTLVKTGGANPGTTNINLALASYDTMGEVVAYINTLPGWVANLIGWAAAASSDLKNIGATNCLGFDNQVVMEAFDNYIIEKLIERATAIIEDFLRRKIKFRSYKMERYSGDGTNEILLNNYPLKTVAQVSIGAVGVIRVKYGDDTKYKAFARVTAAGVELYVEETKIATKLFADYATLALLTAAINAEATWDAEMTTSLYESWPSTLLFPHPNRYCKYTWCNLEVPEQPVTDFEVNYDEGVIYMPSSIPEGFNNIFVTHEAGEDVVPDDLIEYCCEFVKFMYDKRDTDQSMTSESFADYSYSRRDLETVLGVDGMKGLRRYRRPVL